MIRKIALTFAMTGICYSLSAQTIDDALRVSSSNPSGSSRAQSVGGALGSLGGEYSSMFVNPAGVAFFKTSEAAFSLGFQNSSNKGSYLGTSANDSKGNLYVNSAAFIFGGSSRNKNSKWQNVSIGLGLTRTNNYNNNVYYRGSNNQSSFSDNYIIRLTQDNVTNPDVLSSDPAYAHGEDLAHATGLIDLEQRPDGTYEWYSILPDVGNPISQEVSITSEGSMNELSLAVGGNYADKFYIGGSLNAPIYRFERLRTITETNTSDPQSLLNYYSVTENLQTDGLGFNAKLGVIFKPVEPLRIGLTFHTPSWITFTDTYFTSMTTSSKDLGTNTANSMETNNGYADESRYNVTTPWKGIASATYIFNPSTDPKQPTGFLTVDYEYMDYAAMSMKMKNGITSDNQESSDRNNAIDNTYQAASNIRVGGELKLNIFAIRAGYAYYGNPYKNSNLGSSRNYITGGLGYRNRGLYVDLGVVYGRQTYLDQPYVMLDNDQNIPSPPPAEIKNNRTNVTMTVGFKF